MSREAQILNMARAIHLNCHKGLTSTEAEMIAKWCYQEIHRVSLENAREIFEEIEEAIMQSNEISDIRMRELAPHTYKVMREAGKLYYTAILNAIAELKKKYTEEGK